MTLKNQKNQKSSFLKDKYSIDMFISGHIHMGDTYLQNGSIYSHVPPANYFHPVETPHQRGQFAMYDIFPPDNLYPEGSLKIKHINFFAFSKHSFNQNTQTLSAPSNIRTSASKY